MNRGSFKLACQARLMRVYLTFSENTESEIVKSRREHVIKAAQPRVKQARVLDNGKRKQFTTVTPRRRGVNPNLPTETWSIGGETFTINSIGIPA